MKIHVFFHIYISIKEKHYKLVGKRYFAKNCQNKELLKLNGLPGQQNTMLLNMPPPQHPQNTGNLCANMLIHTHPPIGIFFLFLRFSKPPNHWALSSS
jgi:hypothetical protein